MTIYPDWNFWGFENWKDTNELSEAFTECRQRIDELKQQIKMVVCANPETFLKEKNSPTVSDIISESNIKYWPLEKYISYKIDNLFGNISTELCVYQHLSWLLSEWLDGDNFDFYNKIHSEGVSPEEIEKLTSFTPIKDENGSVINYKDDKRPCLYFRKLEFENEYDINDAISDCHRFINNTLSQFKMWAMMDIPALAQAGMEAKDKTKYSDDKFDFTDVVRQLSVMLDDELDFIETEILELDRNTVIKEYFQKKEID